MANPDEAGSILDLAQRIKQHVLKNRRNSTDKGKVFNFALFGSPGSGKSFLAHEMAKSIDPKNDIFSVIEHNLSQFTETNQLKGALEAITSKSVGGKVPFVLWDEFDSVFEQKRGGWLARFLMPMQDAHFFDRHEAAQSAPPSSSSSVALSRQRRIFVVGPAIRKCRMVLHLRRYF